MPELPYMELFPHIHPLNVNQNLQVPELYLWETDLRTHFLSHIPNNYLNEEKLGAAIKFLRKLSCDKIIAIKRLMRRYDSRNMNKTPKLVLENGEFSIFWLFQTSAFILLNEYMERPCIETERMINDCFRNAQNYKIGWNEREGRRRGGANRAHSAETKERFHQKWLNFSEHLKQNTYNSALTLYDYQELYSAEEFAKEKRSPAMRTLKDWCREWKKAL